VDASKPVYVSARDADMDTKYALDSKNAFMLVKIKMKGNPAEDVLADVDNGEHRISVFQHGSWLFSMRFLDFFFRTVIH
jgi:hypothetical protein